LSGDSDASVAFTGLADPSAWRTSRAVARLSSVPTWYTATALGSPPVAFTSSTSRPATAVVSVPSCHAAAWRINPTHLVVRGRTTPSA